MALFTTKDNVAGRWEKVVFRSLFSYPQTKGKPLPPPPPGLTGSWSQQPNSVQCMYHPLSLARAQLLSGFSLEKPLPGKSGPPKVSPRQGLLGQQTLRFHSRHLVSI